MKFKKHKKSENEDWLKHYSYDKSKELKIDFENLKIGDYVFSALTNTSNCFDVGYGIADIVTSITDDIIKTKSGCGNKFTYSKNNLLAKSPPLGYKLNCYQSN